MNKREALRASDLTIGFAAKEGNTALAADLRLSLSQGEMVCLVGPNGAGKSTLLRTLAGLQPALGGTIDLQGRSLQRYAPAERARIMGVVLTTVPPTPGLTVADCVALGRSPFTDWLGRTTKEDRTVVRRAMEEVGVTELARRHLGEISDGERQKTMIARALAQEPQILLLDEPTAFLDLPHRVEILLLLRRLAHHGGTAVLLSTHDLDLALRTADRLWLLPRSGRLHSGTPEDLVLQGAVGSTFNRGSVQFDSARGHFTVHREAGAAVELRGGDRIVRYWTRRALERAGYTVDAISSEEAGQRIVITSSASGFRWQVHTKNEPPRECATLGELLGRLRDPQTASRHP
ncbi:MAG: ABC transporter ATP-binding protein [Synergistales bacterium]|nr:ABC transporter ATP-binding protein [Synergistales bacterium]